MDEHPPEAAARDPEAPSLDADQRTDTNDSSRGLELLQELRPYQIFFLLISTLIGGGDFINHGEALRVAGPLGMFCDFLLVGLITVAVMEGVSELVQLFPTKNAIFEYVRTFIDEELAWVISLGYWWTWVAIYAAQNLAAAKHATYWGMSQGWRIAVFFVVIPIVTLLINMASVYLYGWLETIAGVLKLILTLAVSIMLYVYAGRLPESPISDGLQHNSEFASNDGTAFLYAVPVIAYCFIGVEAVTVAAYEARSLTGLRWPSQWIAPSIFVLYLFLVLSEAFVIKWTNPALTPIYDGTGSANDTLRMSSDERDKSPMAVVAALAQHRPDIASALNVCFIFALISGSNSSLYIASRVLYGLAGVRDPQWPPAKQIRAGLRKVEPTQRVPWGAVIISWASFFWLPFLSLVRNNPALDSLIEIVAVSTSVCCMLTWAALSLSFIRYQYFFEKYRSDLVGDKTLKPLTLRGRKSYQARTAFGALQPFLAWVGLAGSLLVIVSTSATWWTRDANFTNVAAAFGAPVVLLTIWVSLKILRIYVPSTSHEWRIDSLRGFQDQVSELYRWRKREDEPHPAYMQHLARMLRQTWHFLLCRPPALAPRDDPENREQDTLELHQIEPRELPPGHLEEQAQAAARVRDAVAI